MLIVMSFQVNFGPLDVQKISAQVGLLNFKHRGLLFIPHHSALFLGPYLLPNGLNFFGGLFLFGHSPFFLRFLVSSLLVFSISFYVCFNYCGPGCFFVWSSQPSME
jgi:hypothetical protein